MVWDIVTEKEEELEDSERPNDFTRNTVLVWKAYKDHKQRKLQALAIIYGFCTNAVKVYIKGMDDPIEAWNGWRHAQTLPTPPSEECHSFGNSALFVPLLDSHSMPTSPNWLTSLLTLLARKKQSPTWSSRITPTQFFLLPMQSRSRSFNLTRVTIQEVMDTLNECETNRLMTTKPDVVSKALYTQQGGRGR